MTKTPFSRADEIRAEAAALTAAKTTDELVLAWAQSGVIMDAGLSADDHHIVATARGFIIDELVARGDEGLIGL